jgi:hypothetical protein
MAVPIGNYEYDHQTNYCIQTTGSLCDGCIKRPGVPCVKSVHTPSTPLWSGQLLQGEYDYMSN